MSGKKIIMRSVTLSVFISFLGSHAYAQWAIGGNTFGSPTPTSKQMGSKTCHEVRFIANNTEMLSLKPVCLGGGGITFSNAPQIVFSSSVGEINMNLAERFIAPGGTILETDTLSGASMIRTGSVSIGSTSFQGIGKSLNVNGTSGNFISVAYIKANITSKINSYGMVVNAVSPSGTNSGYGYGIIGEGGRIGLYAKGIGYNYSGAVYGSLGYATGSSTSGLRFGSFGQSFGGAVGYGVYGFSDSATTNYAGYFSGNVTVTGQFSNGSDMKLKENIESFNGALDRINKLSVKSYDFKSEYAFMHFPKGKQVGLIAQDLEKVFPELVTDQVHPALENPATGEIIHPTVNYKGVNYIGLIPVTIAAMQEQQKEIKVMQESLLEIQQLKQENLQLHNELSDVKAQLSEIKQVVYGTNYRDVQKTQKPGTPSTNVSLSQNVPNPFNDFTEIKYVVPSNCKSFLEIYTEANEKVRTVILPGSENGAIRINAAGLAEGVYHYDLIVNGKLMESKRFIIAK